MWNKSLYKPAREEGTAGVITRFLQNARQKRYLCGNPLGLTALHFCEVITIARQSNSTVLLPTIFSISNANYSINFLSVPMHEKTDCGSVHVINAEIYSTCSRLLALYPKPGRYAFEPLSSRTVCLPAGSVIKKRVFSLRNIKQEVLGKTNRLLSLIRHGPH
jgi:hypothetical protein